MSVPARLTSKAERTRSAILAAAEALFAARGFEATRLEDVAERVGIRRASIVYYFRDKRELYEAVLGEVFSGLLREVRGALEAPGPLPARIEAAVSAWVEYVGRRPSLPRLLLREVLDAAGDKPVLRDQTQPFFALAQRLLASDGTSPPGDPRLDPAHFASAIAGTSVFYLTALPALVPELGGEPLDAERLRAHREQLLRLTRRLLAAPRRFEKPCGGDTVAEAVYDPFDEFNRAQAGMGRVRNPYARYAELRRKGAVHKLKVAELLGTTMLAPGMPSEIYSVVRHDAVARVLLDGETFSSSGYARSMGLVMGHTILEMDEPEHGRYRGLIQKAFSKRALDRWEHDLVRPVVNGLIDRFAARGHADLVRELTFPFPVTVIAGMIGLSEADHVDFHRMAVELISIAIDPMRGMRASQGLRDLFARVLAERRRAPREDLMSVLALAELDGTRLDDEAIYAFLRLLAPAGAETTYRSSSNLLFGLLTHPDQLEALRADRGLMPQAIEEGLRWECPLTGIMRTATRDVEIDGTPIPAGSVLSVNLGAANRDETRYENPDAFDLRRPQKPHMAFAFGAHRCLGMHLARMETSVVVNALFDRLPGLRLDPAAEDVHITGLTFRSPLALPVVFEPA